MKYPYISTSNTIAIHIDGKQYSINKEHRNFYAIKKLLGESDHSDIPELMDVKNAIEKVEDFSIGNVKSEGDVILYKDIQLDNSLANRIIELHHSGESITKMIAFLVNLMENPSNASINELYDFLAYADLPLTEDGHFLAYKNVRNDFYDMFSGTIENFVGNVVSMERYLVDDDRHSTCSHGLHFCSKEYLPRYSTGDSKTLVLKINPRDVVSIPSDYNNTKGRCCRYEVLCELEDFHDDMIFNKVVVDENKMKMTVRQTIAVKTVNRILKENAYYGGIDDVDIDLMTLRDDLKSIYDEIIDELMVAFDVPITRDRAVKHFKFVKNNY